MVALKGKAKGAALATVKDEVQEDRRRRYPQPSAQRGRLPGWVIPLRRRRP
jgi:hypothetical protein